MAELVERLRLLKLWAGDPSYERIKERVNAAWTAAGRPAARRLAEENPAAALPGLAEGLNNLGHHLSGLGRAAEAVERTREAIVIHRRLVRAEPAAHRPNLATALVNLGNYLHDLGLPMEALARLKKSPVSTESSPTGTPTPTCPISLRR